jgi:hypothetical protein
MKPFQIAGSITIIGLALCSMLTACSFFSQTVAPEQRDRVHAALPIGMDADDAEGKLNELGFQCTRRSGDYPDEDGNDVRSRQFLSCIQRSGTVSFNCENRDQVYVALAGAAQATPAAEEPVEVVDHVSVVRGPNCAPVELPKLEK